MTGEDVDKPWPQLPLWLRSNRSSAGVDSAWVKVLAAECGLAVAAITTAERFPGLSEAIDRRIGDGYFRGFSWFTSERADVASRPSALLETARSIVAVGLPYFRPWPRLENDVPRGRISRYAWGTDYHDVLKRRMVDLCSRIESRLDRRMEVRTLVDTARISDRSVAARAGLGWYGKHTCLIVPGHGSWVLLGEILLDIDLEPDAPLQRDCGRCSICIDRCPTGAIVEPYTLDSNRCISFLTIEERGSIPVELRPKMGTWVFGCDICQDVCPYTNVAEPHNDSELAPKSVRNQVPEIDWLLQMSNEEFRSVFRHTPVVRTKRRGLARNAAIAAGNCGDERVVPALIDAVVHHDESIVRGHAAWALGQYPSASARQALETALRHEFDATARGEIMRALEADFG